MGCSSLPIISSITLMKSCSSECIKIWLRWDGFSSSCSTTVFQQRPFFLKARVKRRLVPKCCGTKNVPIIQSNWTCYREKSNRKPASKSWYKSHFAELDVLQSKVWMDVGLKLLDAVGWYKNDIYIHTHRYIHTHTYIHLYIYNIYIYKKKNFFRANTEITRNVLNLEQLYKLNVQV